MSEKKATEKKARMIEGVDANRVNEATIDRFIKKYGLTVKKNASLDERIKVLARHIGRLFDETQLAECNWCQGLSAAGQPDTEECDAVCPFCGVGEHEDAPTEASAPDPIVIVEPTTPIATALAKRGTPKELDKVLREIVDLRKRAVQCYWSLGQAVIKIYAGKLWQERRDEHGTPKFATFQQFCAGELGMTPQNAFRIMRVSTVFSADEIQEVGTKKLDLLLKIDDAAQRRHLLEKAKTAPLGQIELDVLELTDRKRKAATDDESPGEPAGSGDAPEGKAKTRKYLGSKLNPAAVQGVTAVLVAAKARVKLFARKHPDKPAKLMTDDPTGTLALVNGGAIRIALTRDAKGQFVVALEVVK